jgi:alkylation response protein AidB-like acyl-CoA dehydrogenase
MLNSAGTPLLVATTETDSHQLIAADLRALIAQIEISTRLIDAAMEQRDESGVIGVVDVFVLDDVTPRYATASAALNACRAGLGHALQCLSESGNPA